jgi:hypothetical protein
MPRDFMPTKAVFDQVEPADAVSPPSSLSFGQDRRRAHRLAVDRDGVALLEGDLDDLGRIGRVLRVRPCAGRRIRALRRPGSSSTLPSEEECSRLASTENGASPRLSLAIGIWCSFGETRSASVRLLKVPVAPGRDDLDVGVERIGATARSGPGHCPCRWRRGRRRRRRSRAAISTRRLEISGRAMEVPSR